MREAPPNSVWRWSPYNQPADPNAPTLFAGGVSGQTDPVPFTVHHIPICPFCQRLEVLLERMGAQDAVQFEVVDITVPRSPSILALTGGSTALLELLGMTRCVCV